MKLEPHSTSSAVRSHRLLLVLVCLLPLLALATPPTWWSDREVLDTNTAKNDYGPANQGQLKNIATQAYAEMQAKLPASVWNTPEGQALSALTVSWKSAQGDDYLPINQGQLKAVAKEFYDVLIQTSYAYAYPWTTTTTDDANYAPANIGQVKNTFAFDLSGNTTDSDKNGLPDSWEITYFGQIGVDPDADPDGDGLTNLQEYQNNTNPLDYYNGLAPSLTKISGDNQQSAPNTFLPLPFVVKVSDSSGQPLNNAPVTFAVSDGGGLVAASSGGSTAESIEIRAGSDGIVSVFYLQPSDDGVTSHIIAAAPAAQVTFIASSDDGQAVPDLTLFPANLNVQLVPGETREEILTLTNTGGASDFCLTPQNATASETNFASSDSDQTGGPVYKWNDISNTGVLLAQISHADDDFESFMLPFSFPYFGQSFTEVFVSSNGFITFGEGSDQYENHELPGLDMPSNEIAPFHIDLSTEESGEIFFQNEATRAIIQFENVPRFDGNGNVTFQIILNSDGIVEFLYKDLPAVFDDVTVGLQNATRDQGLTISYKQAYLHPSLAISIVPSYDERPWFQASPITGSLEPGQAQSIAVQFDAGRLASGVYSGTLELASVCGSPPLSVIPITLTVNKPPVVSLTSPSAGSSFPEGEEITLVADALDPDGNIVTVQFFADGEMLAEITSPPFQCLWQDLPVGSHILTAVAFDNSGTSTQSGAIQITGFVDSDRDGLSDDWERATFGNLDQDATGDFDGDGRSNLQEFQNGTAADDYYNGLTPYAVLQIRSRGASKTKHGFFPFVGSSPPRYFLQNDVATRLIGGNPESEVGGTVTTRRDPDTGELTETGRTGDPLPFDRGYLHYDPNPTATSRVDTLTIPFQTESNGGAYNDPPNLVDDHEATGEKTTTLSDEYTTDELISRTRSSLEPIPPFDVPPDNKDDATFADFEFGLPVEDQSGVYLTHSNYQFKWHPAPNLPEHKKVTWVETFYPFEDPRTPQIEDTTPVRITRTWEGTGNESPIYYLSPTLPGRYSIDSLQGELLLDGNRDGKIEPTESDRTTTEKPYRFWLNDDDDTEIDRDTGLVAETEQVPAFQPDHSLHRIMSRRNLEDFSRLWIDFGPIWYDVLIGNVQIGLKWKDAESGEPAINVYPSADGEGSDDYLKDDDAAGAQITGVFNDAVRDETGKQTVDTEGVFMFKSNYWNGLTGDNPVKCLLFEGVSEGKGELEVVFFDSVGNQIGEGGSVWLDLKNIKKMYERFDASGSNQWPPVTFEPDPNETGETIVFVHGWNQSPDGSSNFAETLYKRIWHRGFKGRYAAIRWNTDWSSAFNNVPLIGETLDAYLADYNDSEHEAWLAGEALKNFVTSLPGNTKNLVAHSMGNVVVGSAFRHEMTVDNYSMLHAAVPASCYDTGQYPGATANTGGLWLYLLGHANARR